MITGRVEKVLLYDEGAAAQLNLEEIAQYLRDKLKTARVELRGNPFALCSEKSPDYARKLASIRVQDVSRKFAPQPEPLPGEVAYEQRRILGQTKAFGVIYNGFQLVRLFAGLLLHEERSLQFVHIFFTNRLFATWEESDQRYHLRTSVYGIPSVISTSGLVEAPAKPREYYLLKQQYEGLGKDPLELKERLKGSFLEYEDERLTEVVKGYAMQAVFYSLAGNPFCQDKDCRLFNAHWQEEMILAQLGSDYEFCSQHTKVLASLPTK